MAIHCNKETLPYTLFFEDAYGRKYPIKKLWEKRSQISLETLPILKENARIGLRFFSDKEIDSEEAYIKIETSKYNDVEEKDIKIVSVGGGDDFYWLYGENDGEYPFRMGVYLIELHLNNKVYTGGFQVVPLHLEVRQVESMHQFLNDQVNGIIYDFVISNNSFSDKEDVGLPQYWYYDYARQMSEYYSDFMHGMMKISKQPKDQIVNTYETSLRMQKMDQKSVRWNASNKGILKNRGSTPPLYHYNKTKVQEINTKENQWLKNILFLWASSVGDVVNTIQKDADGLRRKISEIEETINSHLERKNKLARSKNVGENTKRDLKSRIIMTEKDLEKALNQLYLLEKWLENLNNFENKMVYFLNHTFLIDVERNYRKPILKNYQYHQIDAMYQTMKNLETGKGNKAKLNPVLKPTWLVYEYFCLFKVMEKFKNMGFTIDSGLNDNIVNYYFEDRIPEGTHFILEKDSQEVHVWFDHYHANSAAEAKANNESFYMPLPKKKPDIKVDFFEKKKKGLWHNGTLVFDSKFRKLKDIYNSSYNSTTQEQLTSYFNFFCTEEGVFKGRPCVKEVICLYAGDDSSAVIANREPITYLKLFPHNQENNQGTTGEKELGDIIENMLISY